MIEKIKIIETLNFIDKEIKLTGWVNSYRSHGKIIFFDLRDRSGLVQCVVLNSSRCFEIAENLNLEDVIMIEGVVKKREEKMINKMEDIY
jgi:aspartyl-tRNA synthetase